MIEMVAYRLRWARVARWAFASLVLGVAWLLLSLVSASSATAGSRSVCGGNRQTDQRTVPCGQTQREGLRPSALCEEARCCARQALLAGAHLRKADASTQSLGAYGERFVPKVATPSEPTSGRLTTIRGGVLDVTGTQAGTEVLPALRRQLLPVAVACDSASASTTSPEFVATKTGAGAAAEELPGLSASESKAVDSLGQRAAEHQAKLDAYRANPDAFDNQGFLKNAPSDAVRQRIIDGRIRHLEQEIKNFQDQIRKITGGK